MTDRSSPLNDEERTDVSRDPSPDARKSEHEKENEKSQKWKKQKLKVAEKLALEKMRRAHMYRDEEGLEQSLEEIREKYESLRDTAEIQKAKEALTVLRAGRELKEACESNNIEEIKKCMKNIRDKGLKEYLGNELREARYTIEDIKLKQKRKDRQKRKVDLSRAALNELRRYHHPPEGVHPVMQGVLLLLEEDEGSTESWSAIQRILMPYGGKSFHQRIMDFDMATVHPELAARSEEILQKCNVEKLGLTCPVVEMLYVWAMGIIEDMKNDGQDLSEPANLSRQRALLGRKVAVIPQMDRNYYRQLAKSNRNTLNKPNPPLHNSYYAANHHRQQEQQSRKMKHGERLPGSYDDQPQTSRLSAYDDY